MKYGVQMYTLRSLIHNKEEMREAFGQIANYGAEVCELADLCGSTPQDLAIMSKESGIKIGSTHSPYERVINDIEHLVDDHLTYGCNIIGLGSMPLNKVNILSKSSILEFCNNLNKASEYCAKFDVSIDYHNHGFEFKKIADEKILDLIANNTNENVKFCFDMFWAKMAGTSVEEYLEKFKNRINILHFKDYKKRWFRGQMCEVGTGELELLKIIKLAKQNNVSYGYVELDNTKDPYHAVKTGLDFLIKNS